MSDTPTALRDDMSAADSVDALLERNRNWVLSKKDQDPGFFARLVGQQRPRYFWIGCSDSRVPATEIVALDPGEMFVYRNVANIASVDDPSFSAALEFAVSSLRVDHVMVVGHYGCGGVRAALVPPTDDAIGRWLRPLHDLATVHASTLDELDEGPRQHRLCELNVIRQVSAVAEHPVVRDAWRSGQSLLVHGLVYAIGDGLLARVCDIASPDTGALKLRKGYLPAVAASPTGSTEA